MLPRRAYVLVLAVMSCFPDWPDPGIDCSHETCDTLPSSSGPGASTGGTLPTSTGAAASTTFEPPAATSEAPGSSGFTTSSTGTTSVSTNAPGNLPPTIELFTADPNKLVETGPISLDLAASDDHAVVAVRLFLDGTKIADPSLADFPYAHDVLSAKDNGEARNFRVEVEDAEGLVASADVYVDISLPPSGTERCLFTDPAAGSLASSISALEYTADALWAVGTRDFGAGLRLTVWKLDPNDCFVLPGWPKSVADWTDDPQLSALPSIGAAVDLDESGNLVVAGNVLVAGKTRRYVALLTPAGERVWEHSGFPGEEVTSVAAGTGPYDDQIFVGGSQRTSDNPVRTDGAVWIYTSDGTSVNVAPPTVLRAPFAPDEYNLDKLNERSEWVRAIIIHPDTGNALAVGEREVLLADPLNIIYSRAFAIQVQPSGSLAGMPWTSAAPAYRHDAILAVTVCGDALVAGGWTRDPLQPDTQRQPLLFHLENNEFRHLLQLGTTQILGVACDREYKVVNAGRRSSASTDAQVFALTGPYDPPLWYDEGAPSDDGASAAACDLRGYCGWGGYRTTNGKPYAVVRVHHP